MARWGNRQLEEQRREAAKMGSLTAEMTLVQTMERLVGIRRLTDEVLKRQETLIPVTVGNATAHVQRSFLLQVLDAEANGLTEMVRRLLPQVPSRDEAADET